MRVLLISANRCRSIALPMPVGLMAVAECIGRERHEVKVLDLMFADKPVEAAHAAVREFRPDVVGISVRNIDNQNARDTHAYFPELREICRGIKEDTDATIVLGGTAFSVLPKETLEYTGADLGFAGEAQEPFSRLLDLLADGKDYTHLPGLVHRRDGVIRLNDFEFPDLADFTDPYLDAVDFMRYMSAGSSATVVKKLGCPFRCNYCDGRHQMGSHTRLRTPEQIVDNVVRIQEHHGVHDIFFIDPHFNVPVDHAKAVCRELLRRKVKVRWFSTLRPGRFMDREMLHLMKRAGCNMAVVSPDTCSAKMLKQYNKACTKEELYDTCRMLQAARVPYMLCLLLGGPGETRETVEESLAFLRTVKPVLASFTVGLRILPETPLAERAVREGIIKTQSDLIEPTFYIDPAVDDWIDERLQKAWLDHPDWILNGLLMRAKQWVRQVGWRLRAKVGRRRGG